MWRKGDYGVPMIEMLRFFMPFSGMAWIIIFICVFVVVTLAHTS